MSGRRRHEGEPEDGQQSSGDIVLSCFLLRGLVSPKGKVSIHRKQHSELEVWPRRRSQVSV